MWIEPDLAGLAKKAEPQLTSSSREILKKTYLLLFIECEHILCCSATKEKKKLSISREKGRTYLVCFLAGGGSPSSRNSTHCRMLLWPWALRKMWRLQG